VVSSFALARLVSSFGLREVVIGSTNILTFCFFGTDAYSFPPIAFLFGKSKASESIGFVGATDGLGGDLGE